MTGETQRLWLKQADLDEGKRRDGLTSDEQEERRRRHSALGYLSPHTYERRWATQTAVVA